MATSDSGGERGSASSGRPAAALPWGGGGLPPGIAGAVDEGDRVAASVVLGLNLAAAAVEAVVRLLDDQDAPWDFVRSALLKERIGGVLGDLRHMADRAAEVRP
jgi:hypothetical protein